MRYLFTPNFWVNRSVIFQILITVTINYVRRPCHFFAVFLSGMFCSKYLATVTFIEDIDKLFKTVCHLLLQERNFGALLVITVLTQDTGPRQALG
jgi:hypothetical protein